MEAAFAANRILFTNDDGASSPLLVPFIEAVSAALGVKRAQVVVPHTEQSWVAQSVSRFAPIQVQKFSFGTHDGFTATGTPADCASLGIHNLYNEPPQFVFSGINMGVNAGLAFFLSSGTVGGAAEAMLAGVRAAAFSCELPRELFKIWHQGDLQALKEHEKDWRRMAAIAARIAALLVERGAWDHAGFYSVNIPWSANPDTPFQVTQLTPAYFAALFSKLEQDVYQHRHESLVLVGSADDYPGGLPFKAVYRPEHPLPFPPAVHTSLPGDLEVLSRGEISITPISYTLSLNGENAARALG